jgi:hypothetical protein
MSNLVEAEQRFLSLASSQTTDDESARLALHASAGMAIICLCKLSFIEAEEWCKKSRVGWRRMVGKHHYQYVTSVRLTALACELKGNAADAAIFNEIADDTNAKPVPEPDGIVSLSFTAEQSQNVVTKYHQDIAQDHPEDLRLVLHQAAKEGNNAAIRCLLGKRAVIDAQNSQGCTALHEAMQKGHLAVIETLLKNNAQLEARDQEERTPLSSLGPQTGTEALRTLLQAGADVEARDKMDRTALHHATHHPDLVRIQILLLFRAPLEPQDHHLHTPLLLAVDWDEHDKPTTVLRNVSILLEAGANVNA